MGISTDVVRKLIARGSLVSDRLDCNVVVSLDDGARLDVMIRSRGVERLLRLCETM